MAKLSEITAVENGARFFNVDLHVHTYGASADVNDAGMTAQAVVDSAVSQGIAVLAITDHNSDANVSAAITHAATTHAGKVLVLPGVEVTTAHGHLLVYFPPDKQQALNDYIGRLELIGPRGAENTRTAKSMSDSIALAYAAGGMCIAAHIDRERTGFEKFAVGFQNWKKDIICSPGLFGLECDDVAALDWYSEGDSGGDVAAARLRLFNARKEVGELEGRLHLAHLQGSDSHSLTRFQTGDATKPWTRMKMTDLTWEAFRTALTDPTARVKAKATLPKSIPRIRGVAMTGGFLAGEVIHFSDNLNCFIGGRGTGKSTAIRSLAYALGVNEKFGNFDSCPDSIVVYCEDADGVIYGYKRTKGGDVIVRAKEDGTVTDVPPDAFRIEYYDQGEIEDVAKDPLNSPQLLQAFLDRHTKLRDLHEGEEGLMAQLRENGAHLIQLEGRFQQLPEKKSALKDIETKLKIAEEGKLKDIVALQSQITSERTVRGAIEDVAKVYNTGLKLSNFERDYDKLVEAAGTLTTDQQSIELLQAVSTSLSEVRSFLGTKTKEINAEFKVRGKALLESMAKLKENHARLEQELAPKIAELKTKGLAANLAEIEQLLKQKGVLGAEIAAIEQKQLELKTYRDERQRLRTQLTEVRQEMTNRRKSLLAKVNENLSRSLQDYLVFVHYDDAGIIDGFLAFIRSKMSGTYFPEQLANQLCSKVTPSDLAEWVLGKNRDQLKAVSGLNDSWCQQVIDKLFFWECIFELQVLAKPPRPTITVRTRSTPARDIQVAQLSDGQRHTILLTIAVLADSNIPLVIDQPEDDLDNAFIFTSIVSTLRAVKERRQVIMVTHNANIAVLGDSELLLPMQRTDDHGQIVERGSIDRAKTKVLVQKILEGGSDAFNRRKEIYGH